MANRSVLPTHPLFKNLTGKRFGRITVIEYVGRTGIAKVSTWRCRCDCGVEKNMTGTSLQGGSASCGCLRLERTVAAKRTHGETKSVEYRAWAKLIARCEDPKDKSFSDYGGRGIRVCAEWRRSFPAFLLAVGKRPSPRHSIDRIDNEADYKPGNVRWATRVQQNRNKRTNRRITWAGVTKTSAEWAEHTGIPRHTIEKRINSGWDVGRALTTPKRRWRRA